MSMNLITSVPATVLTVGLIGSMLLWISVRLLVASMLGLLFLSIAMWVVAPTMLDIEPWSPAQLIVFLSELPDNYKIAVTASLLTIGGFLVSFHVAAVNWRRQMQMQLRLEAANDIEGFFAEAMMNVSSLQISLGQAVDIYDEIIANPQSPHIRIRLEHWLEQCHELIAKRTRLSRMSIEVHRLSAKHHVVLSTVWGSATTLDRAIESFGRIAANMWVALPLGARGAPNATELFVRYVDRAAYSSFVTLCERESPVIHGFTGGVRGQLLAPIVGVTISGFALMLKKRKEYQQGLAALREAARAAPQA